LRGDSESNYISFMCGCFTFTIVEAEAKKRFKIQTFLADHKPRYNIAPTQNIPVIVYDQDGNRVLTAMKWGLIPSWADDPKIGNRMINARAETVAEKPSFKRSLAKKRCLIPADGFYEWKKNGKAKVPLRITFKDNKPLVFAGLWDAWNKNPKGEPVNSCTIIPCEANSFMKPIHDRIPVILRKEAEDEWLDLSIVDPAKLSKLLVPYPAKEMSAYPVSSLVNSPRYCGGPESRTLICIL